MMKRPLRVAIVAGARPNFMKIAPLIHALSAHNEETKDDSPPVEYELVHTGQHYDEAMSELFFRQLKIPKPHVNLEVGSASHSVQTANVMLGFEQVCLASRFDWVVVVGDVNSTLACTLVAAKLGIRVAHIEAGLRSFDRTMPEEINRLATDALADLLLTPSADADENLRKEGVAERRIVRVGNIMIDALVANLDEANQSTILEASDLKDTPYVYVTLHRPSNVDDEPVLRKIIDSLREISETIPIVFPVHPRTRKMLERFSIPLTTNHRMHILEPVGYHDSVFLSQNARAVITDSGGLQEETTFFRTRCLTLRPNTERPVTVTMGSNSLTDATRLVGDMNDVLREEERVGEIPPLWDGLAGERIVKALVERSGS